MFSQKAKILPKKKILIIEEDVDTADMLTHLMELFGYDSVFSNHIVTVSEIIKVAPDLILLDHKMSNGLSAMLCKKLKETMQTKDIPMIMISASHNLVGIANECGADGTLAKPFDINLLELKMQELLEK